MSCTVVVGGQFGSEGKGKTVALCASQMKSPWVVRCGGPNSGHTVRIGKEEVVLRQVPAGAGHPEAVLLLSAGCAVDEDLLLEEVNRLDLPKERVIVDARAVLINEHHRQLEMDAVKHIGSTASGTGAALIHRMQRAPDVRLAGDSDKLADRVRVESIGPMLHSHLDQAGDVLVEGTQGFGLSLLHGPYYPFATSRDTTAAGFISEVGLSPRHVNDIIMVIRTFPIRVGGNSGPLPTEISWEQVQRISGAPAVYPEYTSVTQRLRRVGRFDMTSVKTACAYNQPTKLAVMGLDRYDFRNHRAFDHQALTSATRAFLVDLERETHVRIAWVGTGFNCDEAFSI